MLGISPDPRTVKNARGNGIEIVHSGRQFSKRDLTDFDWIFAMDKGNLEIILSYTQSEAERSKVKLIRDFDPVKSGNVPDPYHGTEDDFQEVFLILDRTIDHLLVSLTN